MKTEIIDLQPLFAMNNHYFIKFMKEKCFDVLNKVLKSKSGAKADPFFIYEEGSIVHLGYKPIKNTTPLFSDVKIPYDWEKLSRICMVQFVIFEGCKEYGCDEDVPMAGAPEEEHNAFFKFQFDGVEYTYKLWTKRT